MSIHVRPPEANERLLPGHWEGGLIKGKANASAVGTLLCRRSLFAMVIKPGVPAAAAPDVDVGPGQGDGAAQKAR